ncbi:MAG: DUF3459 domain-containing protein, partial [Planctomycetaceae bacterium]
GVILDVVYNHLGPSGNYTGAFSEHYFTRRHVTEWGEAINFDGEQSGPVREFVISNAGYWIDEFHLDGLRLDATQAIVDDSPEHICAALARRAREAAGARSIVIYAEDDHQKVHQVQPVERGGYGLDGLWNDDFHHSARVAATGHAEFYYADFLGTPQELISAVKWGYLYQGQWNVRKQMFRGSPTWNLKAARFVNFLQNHDQVANSSHGDRLHRVTSPGRHRALTALLLLAPETPMLFQGQEFSASAPFHYFVDHEVDLANLVREGRWEFMRHFRSVAGREVEASLIDPTARGTFEQCKLDWRERDRNTESLALHRDLIALRRDDAVFSSQNSSNIYGAVLAEEAFLLRYLGQEQDDRLMLVNLGRDLHWRPAAEPLMAPPWSMHWSVLWSSEHPRYGGSGTALLDIKDWYIPGHATIVLKPRPPQEQSPDETDGG